ncbi:MupA/Atu3671 family FMN-dependent luciferase-like monooxygenase [Nostoc sp. LPT]|uniref:MupA/Atu3671 family FMN-dependent luciferase-like monooxygenase n=1 Tax=Nostoc sp. LPT TaxID=2815387 RepID=UPI001E123014|nr:MupA/Atu3671 family FMN-dependent luciferase-like monooxygenase [Nostoc sp. LPT]MBN4003637.1 LLM class flavin-dependent oxidoreductase [Nostoc sp. LPT]
MNQNNIEDIYELSPLQQGMLFHTLVTPNSGMYFEQFCYALQTQVDVPAFQKAWQQVLDRHPILRTSFYWENLDKPYQVVYRQVDLPWDFQDWRELSLPEQEKQLEIFLAADRKRGFTLSQVPLMRLALIQVADNAYQFVFSYNHILMEGWSLTWLWKEFYEFYNAFCKGEDLHLESPRPFKEYISWLQQQDISKAEIYWREMLEGFTIPTSLMMDKAVGTFSSEDEDHDCQQTRLSVTTTDALNSLARKYHLTLNILLKGAWAILLSRYSGESDIVFGATSSGRPTELAEAESMMGLFANTLPLRVQVPADDLLIPWLKKLQIQEVEMRQYEYSPLIQIQQWSQIPRGLPLFESLLVFNNYLVDDTGEKLAQSMVIGETRIFEKTNYPLTLQVYPGSDSLLSIGYDTRRFDSATINRILGHLKTLLESIVANPEQQLRDLSLLTGQEKSQLLREWNDTEIEYPQEQCIHQLFEAQVERTPNAVAVVFKDEQLTYRELNTKANQLAHYLRSLGVKSEVLVGICVERSLDMIVGLLAILKAGGAYLPLDPAYPQERLTFMLADAQVPVLLTQQQLLEKLPNSGASVVCLNRDWQIIQSASDQNPPTALSTDNLAYTIYTSGSTGKPKGVMVSHRNVVNFFTGMDGSIGNDHPGTWLAVTSISFDISVLELLWTLTRGFQVVINGDPRPTTFTTEVDQKITDKEMAFSLFYFASDEVQAGTDKYHLLLEGAKFADKHAFAAIWTPERHFHEFGGLYPNPSVVSAAIATITERIQIRAGSIVLPLQNPIRVAEEWSVVDNLSRGRVGISFASGWHANDFVLAPDKYSDRFQIMFRDIETVRQLWRGESITLPGGSGKEVEVKIHPQPIQPEVPIWVTAAGSPETFRRAGEIGANLLTHLLDQNVEELEEKIAVYRQSWQEHGHGLGAGHVTLMIHTFVGEDIDVVREKVRQPFYQYLKSSLSLLNNLGKSLGHDINAENFTAQEQEQLLNYAFNRYFERSSLLGTPSTCLRMINRLKAIGVDEVACLIDFGVDVESVLSSLHHLNTVRELSNKKIDKDDTDYSLPAQIARHNVTHLQCTPSLARILIQDNKALSAMGSLRKLMLGGEALPVSLAEQLRTQLSAEIYNMYGPTETTIWSTTYPLQEVGNTIPIGRPIANTEIYILDRHLQPVPVGIPGELYIGGEGVVRGYLNQPQLTIERFISNPFGTNPNNKLYKTGDLAQYLPNGNIEFLGRVDHQVKFQGYRIELSEIETILSQHPGVVEAVVVSREEQPGDKRLVAYVVPIQQAEGTQVTPTEKTHLLADEIIANKPTLSIGDLRAFIKERLPEYMVPSSFVTLNALPLTPNGKIDRSALPAPEASRPELEVSYVAPKTEVEKVIASIWQELLQVERVGIHDNFFELGGNSLLLIQVPSKLQKVFQRDFSLVEMFQYPTISHLVKYFSQESSEETSVLRPAHHSESRTASVQRRKQVRKERRAATQ